MSKYDVADSNGEITTEVLLGSGTLYHQISERFFIMATCAHNFVIFRKIPKVDEDNKMVFVNGIIEASTNGTTFYLLRDENEWKVEMRVVNIVVHPDFFEDGKDQKFLNGTDIAFTVVEIPYEKYRSIKDKKGFQTTFNLPVPAPFDSSMLKEKTNDIAAVAGYPGFTLT